MSRPLGRLHAAWSVVAVTAAALALLACQFPYPADVPDDDAPLGRSVGGSVSGLWTGANITVRLQAGSVSEDMAVDGLAAFAFGNRLATGTSYLVTIVDDGPYHDCVVTNGSGHIQEADVVDVAVECTNLVPHGFTISTPVPFTFDPRVLRYPIAVSLLQQELRVVVTGPTLSSAKVAGVETTIGSPSAAVLLGHGTTTVDVEVTKGAISRRYELVFDRGAAAIAQVVYARAFNAGAFDSFGTAVAVSGEYVAIGAPSEASSSDLGDDRTRPDSGGVYIYRRSGLSWTFAQFIKGTLISSDRRFGAAVAMDGPVLVVGAPSDDAGGQNAGAAYVFRLDTATARWNQEQRVTAQTPHVDNQFGAAVAVLGDQIAIGAPYADVSAGQVHVLRRTGTTWSEEQLLRPSPLAMNSFFGSQLALDAGVLAVGGRSLAAAIRLFRRSGATWAAEPLPIEAVGASVDIAGDVLVVGQPTDASANGQPGDQTAPNAGAIRVFARNGTVWSQTAYLKAATPRQGAFLGVGVALQRDVILTTDLNSGLQPFYRVGGTWLPAASVAPPGAIDLTTFGLAGAIASHGQGVVVGAYRDAGPGGALQESGTAWFFQ